MWISLSIKCLSEKLYTGLLITPLLKLIIKLGLLRYSKKILERLMQHFLQNTTDHTMLTTISCC